MKFRFSKGLILMVSAALVMLYAGAAMAASAYVDLLIPGTARDIGAGTVQIEGGFNTHNGTAHYWKAGSGYFTMDLATGNVTSMGKPATLTNGFGDPFGYYDSSVNKFYAGTFNNAGSIFIYTYDYTSGAWSQGVESVNIYSGCTHNGDIYIAGLRKPWSGGFDNNFISLFDNSGSGYHDALIETGGASAHVALDRSGNVYYNYYSPNGVSELFRWTADQVASAKNDLAAGEEDTYLSLADGEKLSDLPGGGNGIVVDDAGHVLITTNVYPNSKLMMWNGNSGDGDNYELIGVNPDGGFAWFGPLSIEGDFTKGDPLYGSYGFNGPVTEIMADPVPVPSAFLMLAAGLTGLAGMGRRKRS